MEARPILKKYIEADPILDAIAIDVSKKRSTSLSTRDYGNIIFKSLQKEIF